MGKGTTWEIHPKARISTVTMFTTLSGKPKMVAERYMESQMPTKGKNIHLVCPCKQNPYMVASSEKTDSRTWVVQPMQG